MKIGTLGGSGFYGKFSERIGGPGRGIDKSEGQPRSDIEIAKDGLGEGKRVSIVLEGKPVFESGARGVISLLELYGSGKRFPGASAADIVVGKAAAIIFSKLGIRRVHAGTISRAGKEYLEEAGIEVSFGTIVEKILNREKTGLCPFEKTALEAKDSEEALSKMRELSARLKTSPVS